MCCIYQLNSHHTVVCHCKRQKEQKRNYFLSVPTLKEFHKNEIDFGYFGYPLGIPKPHRVFETDFETTDTQRKGSKCFRIFSDMFRNLLNISECFKNVASRMKHMKHNERTTSVGLDRYCKHLSHWIRSQQSQTLWGEWECSWRSTCWVSWKQRNIHTTKEKYWNLNKFCTNTNEKKYDS